MKRILTPAAVAAVLVALAPGAAAQSDQRIVVPLSDPARPATLDVTLLMGSIFVTAYDGNEVIIVVRDEADDDEADDDEANEDEADEDEADEDEADEDEADEDGDEADDEPENAGRAGLRRIPNTSIGLTAEERSNTVSVAVDWSNREVDLEISVPRRTSVHASTVNGDELTVAGVAGEHELSNVNGDISATEIVGSAVAGTRNGDLHVSFNELTPNKAMSFTSFNGDVEVVFPASLAADLRINAGRGEVLTDFDIDVQPQSPVVERSGDAGRYRVRLEREMRAVVGGGGPEIHLKTFNGDIIIRRR